MTATESWNQTARINSLGADEALLVVALEDRSDAIWSRTACRLPTTSSTRSYRASLDGQFVSREADEDELELDARLAELKARRLTGPRPRGARP